jgi:hypothetical protein
MPLLQVNDLMNGVFCLADKKDVDKVGKRFGVHGAGAPGDDDGMLVRSLLREEGDPAEFEAGQDIRVR